jgi:MYXO-CTERM domain-containing protein
VTESAPITVTKGAPCADASTCAKGQKCDAGRCFWDEPTGKLGEACEYKQFCESQQCVDTTDGMFCSSDCIVGVEDSCPAGFTCEGTAGATGFCLVANTTEPGCIDCSSGGDPRPAALIGFGVLGVLLRRRRRRA